MAAETDLWRREGLVLTVDGTRDDWASHAQGPAVLPLSDRRWRIYLSVRDRDNRARMAAVDVDPGDRMRVLAEHLEPMLEPGAPGAFDHAGSGPTTVLRFDGQVWLFFSGVSVRRDVRFQHAIGLAVSDDGLRFRKVGAGPIVSTGPRDPYFSSTPAVVRSGDRWRMWYTSGTGWRREADELEPGYELRTTTSVDGVLWDRASEVAVAVEPPWAGLTQPAPVTRPDGTTRLWFSRRGRDFRGPGAREAYRIAVVDLDRAGVAAGAPADIRFADPPRAGDFDAEAQSYPAVVAYGGDLIMFYNGDDFGSGGLGWARLEGAAR